MNSKQNQNMEPNNQRTIYSYLKTSNINQSLPQNNNSKNAQNIQNKKNSKTFTDIFGNKKEVNDVPFYSLMNEEGEDEENKMDVVPEQPPFSSNNLTNNNFLFNYNSYNPFAPSNLNNNSKDINEKNQLNQNQQTTNDIQMNKFDKHTTYDKKLKSVNIRKSINFLPECIDISKDRVFRIKTYKTHMKPKGRLTTYNDNEKMNDDVLVLNNNIIKEENENYNILIKRIASQLKKRVRPPTKGYFYMKIIRTETYFKKVKKIGEKMRRHTKPPTHGFFYKYIEEERHRKYKLLVKRIAMQLKRRIKFPTCKIIKIYQPYRNLIKKIANELNKSRRKRMSMTKTTTTTTTTIIKNNNIGNINNNNNDMIINNQINYNANDGINSFVQMTKKEINQSNVNNSNNIEKIDIDEEEKAKIIEQKNIDSSNINNNIDINNSQKQSSIGNSIQLSGSNFSFNQESNYNQEQIISEENKLITGNIEGNISHKSHMNPFSNIKAEIISDTGINNLEPDKCEGKCIKTSPNKKKEKKINFNLSLFRKEEIGGNDGDLRLSEEKNKMKNSYKKDINSSNDDIDHNDEQDLNTSQDLNISLSNIEVTKANFIQDFKHFLDKMNIEIVNNFPVSLNEKNKHYFKQSNFWLLTMNYLFYQNSNISLYTIISLLEQYCLWSTDLKYDTFTSIKELIKKYLETNYTTDDLNQFLFMNKFTCLDDIFKKYEIYIKNRERNNYKEIKIDNVFLSNNDGHAYCQCELCTNDEACIKKVSDINKDRINISNSINIDYICQNEKTSPNKDNDISNQEEIFYKGYSKKKQNIFSKSKTICTGNTSLEYNFIHNDFDDRNKNYKGVSQKKEKYQKDKVVTEENSNKEEKEDKEETEEEKDEKKDDDDNENKNKKKIKKTKKEKSRNKIKKKRDLIKANKDENENEEKEEEDEKTEEEKPKSKTKKIKKYKKKKNLEKTKDEEKEKEKEDSEEKDDERENDDSRKKSNSKKKKNKKH
jgi:hypothetical protein